MKMNTVFLKTSYNRWFSHIGKALLVISTLCCCQSVRAQVSMNPCDVSESIGFKAILQVQNPRANDCGARIISVNTCNGTGPYNYYWNSNPAAPTNSGNTPTITVSPSQLTTYTVAVQDLGANQWVTASVQVRPIISGTPSVWVPNIFTPNGDGYNDVWKVLDGSRGTGPINAWGYRFRVFDRWGGLKLERNYTDTGVNSVGIVGGQIQWDGRDSNGGGCVDGTYYYRVDLYNCNTGCSCQTTYDDYIKGWVDINGSSYRVASAPSIGVSDLAVYPNPVDKYMTINASQLDNVDAFRGNEKVRSSLTSYEVVLLDEKGKTYFSKAAIGDKIEIDTSAFPEGTYFLRITDTTGKSMMKQIVVNHSHL